MEARGGVCHKYGSRQIKLTIDRHIAVNPPPQRRWFYIEDSPDYVELFHGYLDSLDHADRGKRLTEGLDIENMTVMELKQTIEMMAEDHGQAVERVMEALEKNQSAKMIRPEVQQQDYAWVEGHKSAIAIVRREFGIPENEEEK